MKTEGKKKFFQRSQESTVKHLSFIQPENRSRTRERLRRPIGMLEISLFHCVQVFTWEGRNKGSGSKNTDMKRYEPTETYGPKQYHCYLPNLWNLQIALLTLLA